MEKTTIGDSFDRKLELSPDEASRFEAEQSQQSGSITEEIRALREDCIDLLPDNLARRILEEVLEPLAESVPSTITGGMREERLKVRSKIAATAPAIIAPSIFVEKTDDDLTWNIEKIREVLAVRHILEIFRHLKVESEKGPQISGSNKKIAEKMLAEMRRLAAVSSSLGVVLPAGIAELKDVHEYTDEDLLLAVDEAYKVINPGEFARGRHMVVEISCESPSLMDEDARGYTGKACIDPIARDKHEELERKGFIEYVEDEATICFQCEPCGEIGQKRIRQ